MDDAGLMSAMGPVVSLAQALVICVVSLLQAFVAVRLIFLCSRVGLSGGAILWVSLIVFVK